MSERPPTLWTHLTRDELMACWALSFVGTFERYEDSYPLEAYATEGLEGPTRNPGEMTRRAIRYLALDQGYEFAGLTVSKTTGGIELQSEVEPRNLVFLLRMTKHRLHGASHAAMPIDPRVAYRTALLWLPEHCPGVDLSALEEALAETDAAAGEWKDRLSPEELLEEEEILDASLAAVGIERVPKGAVH